MNPQPGDIYDIDRLASVQFAGSRRLRLRVIRTHTFGSTPAGWIWLDGYVLNAEGLAVERRQVFVQISGLIAVQTSQTRAARRRPTNTSPSGRLPQQRNRTTSRSPR